MAIHKGGYVFQDKEGIWYARITLRGSSGKRRNVKRRAKDKTEAKKLLRALAQELDQHGEKAIEATNMTFADLCITYADIYEYRTQRFRTQLITSGQGQSPV